jgi:glycosyltransferase involved in cell wall biosynthesis
VSDPLVSVIVPVHCGERFLGAALQSVVEQTYAHTELIVVDDGSTDASVAVARACTHPRLRVICEPHRGVSAARNSGIAAAEGSLIAFLDADDEWAAEKLAIQVALLASREDVAIVHTHLRSVLAADTPAPAWLPPEWLIDASRPAYLPSNWLVRRSAFDVVGGFDETYVTGQDFDWLARARWAGLKSEMVPLALVSWRVHGANATYQRELMRKSAARLLAANIARHRAADSGA